MLGKKTHRAAGAAIVGSLVLLATSTAHAIVDLDAADKSKPAVTFAKELLKATTTHEEVTYYTVNATGAGDDAGLVRAKLGTSVARGKTATVVFSFQNLVFSAATAPGLTVEDSGGTAFNASPTVSAGGTSGDSSVTFTLSPTVALPADAVLELGIPTDGVGISADNPVSITMDVEADPFLVGGTPTTHQASYANAIDAQLSINVTSTPNSVRASVAEGYRKFSEGAGVHGSGTRATLGPIAVSVEPHLKTDGAAVDAAALYTQGNSSASTDASTTRANSFVVAKGDFSFMSSAMFDADAECDNIGGTGDNVSLITGDEKMELVPQNLGWVLGKRLCVQVSGASDATPITEGDYMAEVTLDYVSDVNTDFAPATYTVPYGSIGRDGLAVHIPYLTTDERYNQRIIMVNRGAASTYSMSFTTEDGISTDPTVWASGDLPSGTTVLKTRDVVFIAGGPPHRVSGTIVFQSPPGSISVATNQTNREDGGTDTVMYTLGIE